MHIVQNCNIIEVVQLLLMQFYSIIMYNKYFEIKFICQNISIIVSNSQLMFFEHS